VVVRGQAGLREPPGLVVGEHPERDAGFHIEPADDPDHVEDAVELRPILGGPPGSAHAEPAGPAAFGGGGPLADLVDGQEWLPLDGGIVMSALATVFAVFGAAAGFDAEQFAPLDISVAAVGLVGLGRLENQFGEWEPVHGPEFVERLHPERVGADGRNGTSADVNAVTAGIWAGMIPCGGEFMAKRKGPSKYACDASDGRFSPGGKG